jgi:hypothetical protein
MSKKNHLSQSLKKLSLERSGITPSALPHPKKTLLKNKNENLTPCLLFL